MKHRDRDLSTMHLSTLIMLVALTLVALPVLAESVSVTYEFEQPVVSPVAVGTETYDRVIIDGLANSGEPGQPLLPAKGGSILLPLGYDVDVVTVTPSPTVSLGTGHRPEPAGRPYRLSDSPESVSMPVPDQVVYGSPERFPGSDGDLVTVQTYRGFRVATVKLHPVSFIGSTGELAYSPTLTVDIKLRPADANSFMLRGLSEDLAAVQARVDNPEAVATYSSVPLRTGRSYELLIITTPDLAFAFQQLKDYHDTTGTPTEIHTTADVGSTAPDDVRDYIRDRYNGDGIEYVLIAADDDLIPAKDLWVEAWSGGDVEEAMPTDIYFGCLDGTFNYDSDSRWGEPNDGPGGGDVDLTAEVYVGRASVGGFSEADRFCRKTIEYLTTTGAHLGKVLMVGEYLGFGGISDYAGNMMDQIVDGSSADGYTTVGIPSSVYSVDRLYDRDWPGNDWSQWEFFARLWDGLHIVNHLGHGSPDWAIKSSNDDIDAQMFNEDLCFIYSQTCLAGHFDDFDCWAEHANVVVEGGAFAVVMNARYGWGSGYSTDGPSHRFNREFWDAVYNGAENKMELGRAQQDSKEDNLYRIDESCMRWVYYESNLFGDPSVRFRDVVGLSLAFPGGVPTYVSPSEQTAFQVTVMPVGDGVAVAGSGQLHYRIDSGELETVPMTEASANTYTASLPAVNCGSQISFYVSAEEATNGRFYYPDTSNPPTAIPISEIITVFADDFQNDLGWTVSGTVADGAWERAVPSNGGDRGDCPSDYDGSGMCWVTDDGVDADIDGGTTILTSPVFDLSDGDATVSYARWYCNDYGASPNADEMYVYISNNNGGAWQLVETVGPVVDAAGGRVLHEFVAGSFVTPTSQMRLRFDASDLGSGSVVEAGLDAVSVKRILCEAQYICGDIDGNQEGPNVSDLVYLVSYMFRDGPEPPFPAAADVDHSETAINISDLVYMVSYMFKGGPELNCP